MRKAAIYFYEKDNEKITAFRESVRARVDEESDIQVVAEYIDRPWRKDKRVEFGRLLEAAKAHEFDLIFVRNLPRLSRNGAKLAELLKELKTCEPEVYFWEENFSLKQDTAGLIEKVLTYVAGEESRRKSLYYGHWERMSPGRYKDNGEGL